MLNYRDQTQLLIATEDAWAENASDYELFAHIQENLNPAFRTIKASSLDQQERSLPMTVSEEMVAGDLEFLASSKNFEFWLPKILNTTAIGQDYLYEGNTGERGIAVISDNELVGLQGEFIYTSAPEMSGLDGWQVIDFDQDAENLRISNLPENTNFPSSAKAYSRRYLPSDQTHSVQILKRIRDDQEWIKIDGGMLQRLTIDLDEGQFLTATASLIARSSSQYELEVQPQKTDQFPISFAHGISNFYLEGVQAIDQNITHQNSIIMGLRLVLERQGMQAQFGLGDVHPKIILPGELSVYGSFELLISDHQLLSALQQHDHLRLGLAMHDGYENGLGFTLHDIVLTDISVLGQGEVPLRAECQFQASAQNNLPLISAFTANKAGE